jgi:hypothetical protein
VVTGLYNLFFGLFKIKKSCIFSSVRKIYGNEVKTKMKDAAVKIEQQKILELDLLMFVFNFSFYF